MRWRSFWITSPTSGAKKQSWNLITPSPSAISPSTFHFLIVREGSKKASHRLAAQNGHGRLFCAAQIVARLSSPANPSGCAHAAKIDKSIKFARHVWPLSGDDTQFGRAAKNSGAPSPASGGARCMQIARYTDTHPGRAIIIGVRFDPRHLPIM